MLSCVWLFATPWTTARQLLCPWNSPDKNTGVGCHSLFQKSSRPRDQTHNSCISGIGRWIFFLPLAPPAAAKSLQSCPTACDPIDGSPPGSPVHGLLQARKLEWAAISFSNAWKWKVKVKSLSCVRLFPTPWKPGVFPHCSLPGSSVHGIFQARVLEWGAIAFSA